MTLTRVRVPHLLTLLALAALVPVGCGGGDGVNSYNAPKTTEPAKREKAGDDPHAGLGIPPVGGGPVAAGGDGRILGGIFPADNPQWFFKMPGPAGALTPYEAGFDQLLASVSLPANGGTPEFVPPEGWKRGPGRQFVAATVRTPDGKYEVSIAASQGGVEGNLARWAEQLGTGYASGDSAKFTRAVDAKGVKGLRADMRGPKMPPMGGAGPMMGKR